MEEIGPEFHHQNIKIHRYSNSFYKEMWILYDLHTHLCTLILSRLLTVIETTSMVNNVQIPGSLIVLRIKTRQKSAHIQYRYRFFNCVWSILDGNLGWEIRISWRISHSEWIAERKRKALFLRDAEKIPEAKHQFANGLWQCLLLPNAVYLFSLNIYIYISCNLFF